MLRKEHIDLIPLRALIPNYLMASFCYYVLDDSPMTDDAFDYLCKKIVDNKRSIEHEHKALAFEAGVESGTCLLSSVDFPARVQVGFERYLRDAKSGELERTLRGMNPEKVTQISARRRVTTRAAPQQEDTTTTRRVTTRRPAPAPEQPAARRRVTRRS